MNPRAGDAVVPRADGAIVPRAGDAIVPRADGAVVPRADGAVVPRADGAMPPPAADAIVPPAADAIVPRAADAIVPRAADAIVPRAADAMIHRISAWDGLRLHVREWSTGTAEANRLPPVLCLPGLVRTGADFEALAPAIIAGRRVIAVDYPGRGDSGRSRDVARYAPEPCVRDVMDVCAALHIHHAVVIGTSFGGLLAMGLATARPGLVRGVVLNDIGPEIGSEGADFVRDFVGQDPALESLEACVALLRGNLPPMSLDSDAAWRRMAELTYQRGPDGRFHPVWDTAIVKLLNRPPPDLWPLFDALSQLPVLLVRGAVSNILLPETVTRMQAIHPGLEVVTLPGIGHAPILTEPPALAAIERFLHRTAREPGAWDRRAWDPGVRDPGARDPGAWDPAA
jgi:pimeloyl-ACP methyl ester carboxylesterase